MSALATSTKHSIRGTSQGNWRRQWHPTPVLLPGKSHGRRSLVGCSPWGCEESDTTERFHFDFSLSCIGEGMATHSSVLACRISGMAEPGGLPSMGWHRVGHDLAAAAAESKRKEGRAESERMWVSEDHYCRDSHPVF